MRRWRTKAAILAVVAMVATLVSFVPTTDAPRAEAAVAANFDPGNIVSDQQFFDGDAMSAQQVQAFLNGQAPDCRDGYTCLNEYAQATPAMDASMYCDALPGNGSRTAAQIIADVSFACDISPKVLIVLLQKEQSLVTHPAPAPIRYERATGFACPDTAPCDASFGGFFYQIYYAARQFQRYAMHPQSYNHQAGEQNQVLYHPNAACGSSTVLIQNQATAGLYNYTPYQPNRAALANLYGTGDSCSAYGNRNFWRMWTDWFGDPRAAESTSLIRNASSGAVYLVMGTARHHVPTPAILAEFTGSLGQPRDVSAAEIARYTEGSPLSRVVLGADGGVHLVDNGILHRFPTCSLAQAWTFSCDGHVRLDAATQRLMIEGAPMSATVEGTDGHDWLIQSGTRRELADVTIPTRYGYPSARVALDADAVAHLRVGGPVLDSGTAVRNSAGTVVRVKTPSGIMGLSAAQAALPAMRSVQVFTDASLQQLEASAGTVPTRLRTSGGAFLLTAEGVLRVDPARYGGTGSFTQHAANAALLQALPSAGTELRPHFVRERGTTLLYLASGSKLQPVDGEAAYNFIRATFGVPGTIHEVPAGGLHGVPKVLAVDPGELVHGSDGRVHLWDGERAMYLMHPAFASALGIEFQSRRVADDVIAGLPEGPWIGSFGFTCGGTDYAAYGGELHRYASGDVAADWGLRHVALSAQLCGELPVSSTDARQFISAGGRVYLMDDGQKRYITSIAILGALGGTSDRRSTVPVDVASLLPSGPDMVSLRDPGTFVRGSNGRVHLWDGDRAFFLMHPDFAAALGLQLRVENVSDSTIASMPKGPWIGNYRFSCGGTDSLAFDGALHPFASDAARAAWAMPTVPLSGALCATLDVGAPISQFVYEPNGRTYIVEDGALRYIPSSAIYQELGGREAGRTLIPASMADRLPEGPSY